MLNKKTIKEAERIDQKIYDLITEMEEFDETYSLIRLTQAYCVLLDKISNSGEMGQELLKKVNTDIVEEHGYQIVPLTEAVKPEKPVDPMFM